MHISSVECQSGAFGQLKSSGVCPSSATYCKEEISLRDVVQAHLSTHAGIESLSQQALRSRHHPCQIDGTALLRLSLPAPVTSGTDGQSDKAHGLTDSQPVSSHGKHAVVEPAADRQDGKQQKGLEPGLLMPRQPDRKPLQELQPGQALPAFPAACLSGTKADKFQKADQPPSEHVQQEQLSVQPNEDTSQGLKPQSGISGHRPPVLESLADSKPADHMQQSGQRSAHEDSAASLDRACEPHDFSGAYEEAPKPQPEGHAESKHQHSLDLIDLFKVRLNMESS